MKIARMTVVLTLCGLSAWVVGCSKKEEAPATPAAEATPAMEAPKPPEQAATEVQKQADAAKVAVDTHAVDAATEASTQAQSLIDKAKGLIDGKQYPEALNVLNEVANLKLTLEQQKLVDDLKAQVQKLIAGAAASDAANPVGGLLGGEK